MIEDAVRFGATQSLVGILTTPSDRDADGGLPAVILLNSGLVHRPGPNRIYVKIARSLAAMGYAALRFDFSGIGDSGVREDNLPFARSCVIETQEAMDFLNTHQGSNTFILMGICSGALASLRTARQDPRVVGAVLINPAYHLHDRDDADLDATLINRTQARHYWRILLRSSFRGKGLVRALTGRIAYRTILKAVMTAACGAARPQRQRASTPEDAGADLLKLAKRGARVLHVCSEGDPSSDYLRTVLGSRLDEWRASGLLELEVIPGTNHTFMLLEHQEYLVHVVRDWARSLTQHKERACRRAPDTPLSDPEDRI